MCIPKALPPSPFPEHTHLAKLEANQPEETVTMSPPLPAVTASVLERFYSLKFDEFSI